MRPSWDSTSKDKEIDRGDIVHAKLHDGTALEALVLSRHDGWLHLCSPEHRGLFHAVRPSQAILLAKQGNYEVAPSRLERISHQRRMDRKKALPHLKTTEMTRRGLYGTEFVIYCLPNPSGSAMAIPIGVGFNSGESGERGIRLISDLSALGAFCKSPSLLEAWKDQASKLAEAFANHRLSLDCFESENVRAGVPSIANGESVDDILSAGMARALPWASGLSYKLFDAPHGASAPKLRYSWASKEWRKPGQRVLVDNPHGPPIEAHIVAFSKAWIQVQPVGSTKAGVLRCRISTVTPIPDGNHENQPPTGDAK